MNREIWFSGGSEYLLVFNKGQHELREYPYLSPDSSLYTHYEIVAIGHYDYCKSVMQVILQANVEYDYNL